MNTLEKFEKGHLKELQSDNKLPKFSSGDTIKVHLKIKEGEKERIQVFEGVCISKKNAGLNSSFTVRKISYGEGIERILPLFSPQINKIEVATLLTLWGVSDYAPHHVRIWGVITPRVVFMYSTGY